MNTLTKTALIALMLLHLSACSEVGEGRSSTSSSSSSGEIEPEPTTGEENGSSSTGSSTGEGSSSSSSSGEVEEIEPDPQPDPGEPWGPCTENTCGLTGKCFGSSYPEWEQGFCTKSCDTVSPASCIGSFPASGSSLACAKVSELPHRTCVLDCTAGTSCPIGMECTQLPFAEPDAEVQRVCV